MSGNERKPKMCSRENIAKLMDRLPSKINRLLKECVGRPPLFVPDYLTFNVKAIELLKPLFEYSDSMFHAGVYSNVFRSAVRKFALKKMECEHFLQKSKKQLQQGKAEAIDVFMRYKLLFSFFRYTEQKYPGNMFQLFDLEYRLEHEKDSDKREELLSEISKIVEESSTKLYAEALTTFSDGDLSEALKLCDQAIEKFPGNTPAYKLKIDILQAVAKKTIEEGLRQEPEDQTLLLSRYIESHLWRLRQKFADGLVDLDIVISELERSIQEEVRDRGIELRIYEQQVKKSLPSNAVVKPETLILLCTGEFLLRSLVESLDYAPSAIEFCKAVENELLDKIFDPFKIQCQKNMPDMSPPERKSLDYILYGCIYRGRKFTLGCMAMLLRLVGKKQLKRCRLIQELKRFVNSFPKPDLLIGVNGIRSILTPEAVNDYRNSSAHLSTFTAAKAYETKSWCYRILNLLTCAVANLEN